MDDVIDRDKLHEDEWYHELRQTSIGVARVKRWARDQGNVLNQDDILISADVDEVMSASALNQLRWCETKQVRLTSLWEAFREKNQLNYFPLKAERKSITDF